MICRQATYIDGNSDSRQVFQQCLYVSYCKLENHSKCLGEVLVQVQHHSQELLLYLSGKYFESTSMSKLGQLYFAFPCSWPLFVNVQPKKQRYIKNMSLAKGQLNYCPCC